MEISSDKIKALRSAKGWSQEDMARRIEVSLSTIQRWEGRGADRITRHGRKELARLFKQAGISECEMS